MLLIQKVEIYFYLFTQLSIVCNNLITFETCLGCFCCWFCLTAMHLLIKWFNASSAIVAFMLLTGSSAVFITFLKLDNRTKCWNYALHRNIFSITCILFRTLQKMNSSWPWQCCCSIWISELFVQNCWYYSVVVSLSFVAVLWSFDDLTHLIQCDILCIFYIFHVIFDILWYWPKPSILSKIEYTFSKQFPKLQSNLNIF